MDGEEKEQRPSNVPQPVKVDSEITGRLRAITMESVHEALRTRPAAHWSKHVADRVLAVVCAVVIGWWVETDKIGAGTGLPVLVGLLAGHETLLRFVSKRFGG